MTSNIFSLPSADSPPVIQGRSMVGRLPKSVAPIRLSPYEQVLKDRDDEGIQTEIEFLERMVDTTERCFLDFKAKLENLRQAASLSRSERAKIADEIYLERLPSNMRNAVLAEREAWANQERERKASRSKR